LELLAKSDGDFVQRIETAGVQARIDLTEYTTEDLKLMLKYMRDVGIGGNSEAHHCQGEGRGFESAQLHQILDTNSH